MMKYSETHEWIKIDGSVGTVGITDYAQRELGDIVYIELPSVGKKVNAGQEVVVLESTKAAADVYSPVTGIIKEINDTLSTQPDLVNRSPENEGWIYKITLESLNELDELMSAETYLAQFKR